MAGKTTIEVVLPAAVVLMAALLASTATAQSSSSCSNTLISLSPCLTYITGNSSTPSSGCCTQLAAVVKNQPECLCQVIAGGGSSIASMNINQTQALALPQACNVQTPPVSRCNVSSPPGSGGAGTSPTTTSSTPGGGSKTTPTTSIETSQGNQSKSTLLVFLTFLFAASIFVKN